MPKLYIPYRTYTGVCKVINTRNFPKFPLYIVLNLTVQLVTLELSVKSKKLFIRVIKFVPNNNGPF